MDVSKPNDRITLVFCELVLKIGQFSMYSGRETKQTKHNKHSSRFAGKKRDSSHFQRHLLLLSLLFLLILSFAARNLESLLDQL